jgi:hypothetical protein
MAGQGNNYPEYSDVFSGQGESPDLYAKDLKPIKGNEFSQFYNYAKYWYKKSDDVVADLKIILSNYCGMKPEHLSLSDLNIILLEIAEYEVMQEKSMNFKDFVFSCSKEGLVQACLNIMANSPTGYKTRLTGLYRPSSKILPLENAEYLDKYHWFTD